MNQHLRMPGTIPTTQAAEGLMRRSFSVAEIEAMVKAGILDEDERFELIGGEVVPMSPKGIRHEVIKTALMRLWAKRCPDEFGFALETTFRLNANSFVEPDFVFYRTSDGLARLTPQTALLAVEVADTSLSYDLGRKVRIYANAGVREVWVINAQTLETHTHRHAGIDGYTDITVVPGDMPLTPSFAPVLTVNLAALELS